MSETANPEVSFESEDRFYSKTNLAHLERSIEQLRSGQAQVHDLIEEDDDR